MPALLAAAALGYLIGSISFARLLLVATNGDTGTRGFILTTQDRRASLASTAQSATAVRTQKGAAAGCLVGALDMAKSSLPMLLLRSEYPDAPYYLVFGTLTVVGHIWPVFHRFRGGRGQSPILGGMLVLDWVGVLATNVAALLIGVAVSSLPLILAGGMALMVPWILIRSGDMGQVAYAIVVNGLYWYAMRSELRQYRTLRRSGHLASRFDLAGFMGMRGLAGLARRLQNASLQGEAAASDSEDITT